MISLYGVGYGGAWLAAVVIIASQLRWSYLWFHLWNDLIVIETTASCLLWLGRCMVVAGVASKFKVSALTLIKTMVVVVIVAREQFTTATFVVKAAVIELHQKFDWFYRLSFLHLAYASQTYSKMIDSCWLNQQQYHLPQQNLAAFPTSPYLPHNSSLTTQSMTTLMMLSAITTIGVVY